MRLKVIIEKQEYTLHRQYILCKLLFSQNVRLQDIWDNVEGKKACGVIFDNGFDNNTIKGKRKKVRGLPKPPEATTPVHAALGDKNASGKRSALSSKSVTERPLKLTLEDRTYLKKLVVKATQTGDYTFVNSEIQRLSETYSCIVKKDQESYVLE